MNKKIIALGIYGVLAFVVLYPLWVRGQAIGWSLNGDLTGLLFPFFGLLMVSLLWTHSMAGAFENWLRQYVNFDSFVSISAMVIFWCLILHPLLLLASLSFSLANVYAYYGATFIYIGVVSWLLLISYDGIKALKKRHEFFAKHWNKVLFISNLGFLLSFFHSLTLGSDLYVNPLRGMWFFLGITAAMAIAYTYIVKPFIRE